MIPKEFYRFITEKHVKNNYKRCVDDYNAKARTNMNFEKFITSIPLMSLISGAFDWDGTTDGYEFWRRLNEEWMKTATRLTFSSH